MLKIKETADLKILEKFGFEDCGNYYRIANYIGNYAENGICIHKEDREIDFWGKGYLDLLFDLIQEGLVVKGW